MMTAQNPDGAGRQQKQDAKKEQRFILALCIKKQRSSKKAVRSALQIPTIEPPLRQLACRM
jgi:hypothetical protein